MSSKTQANYPIVAALVKAEDLLGPDRIWNQVNMSQADFLSDHFMYCRGEVGYLDCIESVADLSVDTINQFLEEKGFDIRLDELSEGSVYAASVLDVLLKWIKPGKAGKITAANQAVYDAFTLDSNSHDNSVTIDRVRVANVEDGVDSWFEVFRVRIQTENGDYVNLLVDMPEAEKRLASLPEENINDLLDFLLDHGADDKAPKSIVRRIYDKLTLPMISLNQENDITWLCGMSTRSAKGEHFEIAQAFQQNKLKMNEFGVRAQSAVAIGIFRKCVMETPTELIVDSPFIMWIERPGCNRPLFVGYLDYDSWSNPGSLES